MRCVALSLVIQEAIERDSANRSLTENISSKTKKQNILYIIWMKYEKKWNWMELRIK